ncbi:CLUMA_CG014719, isoform A [Clunio marinus]|uniref:CLUMA_CG014719, isoform A n=1 Tax=Clunio marinus TaxID=568069 RepID=A0A1J1IPH6_9DIPT|nr:CLUMA_CG014719, isoform A [Clunio marinus]
MIIFTRCSLNNDEVLNVLKLFDNNHVKDIRKQHTANEMSRRTLIIIHCYYKLLVVRLQKATYPNNNNHEKTIHINSKVLMKRILRHQTFTITLSQISSTNMNQQESLKLFFPKFKKETLLINTQSMF